MYNTVKEQVWYGELKTSKGNIIIIHDKEFPSTSSGKVYLYNTQKNAIIKYMASITQGNLYDLSEEQKKAAEEKYGAAWEACREEFMALHQGWTDATHAPPPKKKNTDLDLDPDDDWPSDFDSIEE